MSMDELPLRMHLSGFGVDEDDLFKLQHNDPSLTSLVVGLDRLVYGQVPFGFIPHQDDWERLGECIGRNEFIEELGIGTFGNAWVKREGFEQFFTALAKNTSIKKLHFHCEPMVTGEGYAMISPFLRNNTVEELIVEEMDMPTGLDDGRFNKSEQKRQLAIALTKFTSLKSFRIDLSHTDGHSAQRIFESLAGHQNLEKLHLSGDKMPQSQQSHHHASLVTLLRNQESKLMSLSLGGDLVNDDMTVYLSIALAGNRTLKRFSIQNNRNITAVGWKAVATLLEQCHLEKFSLSSVFLCYHSAVHLANTINRFPDIMETLELFDIKGLRTAGWLCLTKSMRNITNLQFLEIGGNNSIASGNLRAVISLLTNETCKLQGLDIHHTGLNDDIVSSLAKSLSNNSTMKKINLASNRAITYKGWHAFSSVFESEKSVLEYVDLRFNPLGNDVAALFAKALANNRKLHALLVNDCLITEEGWRSIFDCLCNAQDILSTYSSNHTLEMLTASPCIDRELPVPLQLSLDANCLGSKFKASRYKILGCHFSGCKFSLDTFIDMDIAALPHALAWIGMDDFGTSHSLMYKIILTMPELLCSQSKRRKRKLQQIQMQ